MLNIKEKAEIRRFQPFELLLVKKETYFSETLDDWLLMLSPTVKVVSPLVTLASTPLSMAFTTAPKAANAKISPVAASTDGSITPIGGKIKEAMRSPTAVILNI